LIVIIDSITIIYRTGGACTKQKRQPKLPFLIRLPQRGYRLMQAQISDCKRTS
jgi:hypothetical protein